MGIVIIIPARFQSSRFPGKPLALLRGGDGVAKPLIQRSWEMATRVPGVDAVYVATDHRAIADAAVGFGAKVLMTSSDCRNGTERCAEALDQLAELPDLIVNVQGDAPLTPDWFVSSLIDAVARAEGEVVTTPAIRCTPEHLTKLREEEALGRIGGTTVVTDSHDRALYFSKRLIPHFEAGAVGEGQTPVRLHIGVYAYTPAALRRYMATPPTELERLEGLEQLRFLDSGVPVYVTDVAPPPWQIWELNNPSDVAPIEAALARMGNA